MCSPLPFVSKTIRPISPCRTAHRAGEIRRSQAGVSEQIHPMLREPLKNTPCANSKRNGRPGAALLCPLRGFLTQGGGGLHSEV